MGLQANEFLLDTHQYNMDANETLVFKFFTSQPEKTQCCCCIVFF